MRELASIMPDRTPISAQRVSDPADQLQLKEEMDLAVMSINTNWATKRQIQAALQRLESGDYGICESCGEPINPKRLKAVPWASRCVPCQAEEEGSAGDLGQVA
jgi:DnaK suppressor protein